MDEKPPHPDTDPEKYLDQVRFFVEKDGIQLGVIPAFAMLHYVDLARRRTSENIHATTEAQLKAFVDSNRKICWEAEFEDNEYCIGERKVEKYFYDIIKTMNLTTQKYENANAMRMFYQGMCRGAMERNEELVKINERLAMILAFTAPNEIDILESSTKFHERFATWADDNNWTHVGNGKWEHGFGASKITKTTAELFAECAKTDPK